MNILGEHRTALIYHRNPISKSETFVLDQANWLRRFDPGYDGGEQSGRPPSRREMGLAARKNLFETLSTVGLMLVLLFCLSVYVISLPVKTVLMLTTACLFLNRGWTFSPVVWPLLAIPLYEAAVSWKFPCPRPDLWTILQSPLFTVLCVLLVSVVLSRTEGWRSRCLAFGILLVCLIGAVGDTLGYDMLSALPFTMPDDANLDQVTLDKFGSSRVRGFFPESGVLGAVSLGLATCLALGAWVQFSQRRHPGAMVIVLASVLFGGAMLGLTLTKSGIFMVAAGLVGFLVLLAIGRNRGCRIAAAIGFILMVGGSALLLAVPGDLGAYFRAELGNALSLQDQTGQAGGDLSGRVECWKLALYSVKYYPCGVGGWGVDTVLNRTTAVVPTSEMRYYFDRDMFGLKSGLANLVAQTGLVGVFLLGFWLWLSFIGPAFRHLRTGTHTGTLLAGLYGASAGLSLMFLFTCELYPSYALLLFFKLHADAIARHVQVPWFERASPPVLNFSLMKGATT